MGNRMGTILQTVFGFIAAVIIAFTASWELSLIVMLCFPVLAMVGFFQLRLLRSRSEKNKNSTETVRQVAMEFFNNIHTVAELGVEERLYRSYVSQLQGPFW